MFSSFVGTKFNKSDTFAWEKRPRQQQGAARVGRGLPFARQSSVLCNGKSLLRRCEIGEDFVGGGQDRSLDFLLLGGVARGQGLLGGVGTSQYCSVCR